MRAIKYRAYDKKTKAIFPIHKLEWDKISNQLIHLSGVDIHDKDSDFEGNVYYGGHPDKMTGTPLVRRYELMQFTGLYDDNGKEVYEGDIVTWYLNYTTYTSPICYDTNLASFWMGKDSEKRFRLVLNDWMRGEYEVIGNIYEHPHLLDDAE